MDNYLENLKKGDLVAVRSRLGNLRKESIVRVTKTLIVLEYSRFNKNTREMVKADSWNHTYIYPWTDDHEVEYNELVLRIQAKKLYQGLNLGAQDLDWVIELKELLERAKTK